MDAFERDACRRFASVIAVSARDATALERRFGLSGVETIDTGVDLDYFRFSPPGEAPDAEPDWTLDQGLEPMTAFLETKTVWHPIGV